MPSFSDTYHTRSTPPVMDGVQALASDTRDRLRQNDREGVAWHYGLPRAADYEWCHADYRRTYTRAVKADYASVCRWIAARGYPLERAR